jgi:rubrerythrin
MGRIARTLKSIAPWIAGAAPVLLLCAGAMARAGGGEGSGGGGGGSGGGGGGGGGGDLFILLYYWIQFCLIYPYIGLPVTAGAIVLFIYASRHAQRIRQTSVIRRGIPLISADRSRAAIEQLVSRDPNFDPQRAMARIADAFQKVQRAWCDQDMSKARAFISDGVFERFTLQIAEQRDLGWRDVMEQVQVLEVALAEVWQGEVFTTATVRIRASAANYRVSIADGSRVSGSQSPGEFVEYWTFLRRSDAQTVMRDGLIEGHCPNCGVNIEMNQNAVCPQCGSLLRSGRYDWVLVEITQEYEWTPRVSPSLGGVPARGSGEGSGGGPPGLDAMREHDPELNLAGIEDRASVLFWRWVMSQRVGDLSLLARAADDDLLARWQANLDNQRKIGNVRTWLGECAVGAVETQRLIEGNAASSDADAKLDRAIVLVRWMGTQFQQALASDGHPSAPSRGQRSHILQTLLVLSRAAGATTDADRGVSSAHCPHCGAPETGGAGSKCPYCGTILNDGKHGWVLHDLVSAASPQGRALLDDTRTAGAASLSAPSAVAMLTWMARMAGSDGTMDDSERELIEQVADRRGIPPARVDAILSAAQTGDGELPAPADPQEARQWLEALASTAWSDGRIAPQELALLQSAGARAGLSPYDLRLLLTQQRRQMHQSARNALRNAKVGR